MTARPRVRLYDESARATHTTVHAEIDEDGSLLVSGRGVGVTPEEAQAEEPGEFGLRIREPERALLLLLQERFGGEPTVLDDLEAWLEEHGLAFERGI